MVRDSESGKYRRARLFVLTLGYSRKSVLTAGVPIKFADMGRAVSEKAFRRLGGVTRVVVLDNLREGVLNPDIYDPTLNPLYRDMFSGHYGAAPLPCRVGHPDRKGKVESGVGHAKRTPKEGASASRVSRRRRITLIGGRRAGLTRASTARPNARSRPCSPKSGHLYCRCQSSLSAITYMESARYIWMAA